MAREAAVCGNFVVSDDPVPSGSGTTVGEPSDPGWDCRATLCATSFPSRPAGDVEVLAAGEISAADPLSRRAKGVDPSTSRKASKPSLIH